MDSYFNRFNAIFYTFISCIGLAAMFNHGSSYFFSPHPTAQLEVVKISNFYPNSFLGCDQADVVFDMHADMRPEFHWNQNQLFVYLVARYESDTNKDNIVVLWDAIIRNKEEAKFSLRHQSAKYPMRDQYHELKNRTFKLELRYMTMPIVGFLAKKKLRDQYDSPPFTLPGKYFRS